MTEGSSCTKIYADASLKGIDWTNARGEAMRVLRLFGLGFCCFLLGIGEAYGQQRPFPSPNDPDEQPREECNATFTPSEQCENQGGGGGDTSSIELAGPVTRRVEYRSCVREIVFAGVIPIPIFGVQKIEYKHCIDPYMREGVCISGMSWPEVGPCV